MAPIDCKVGDVVYLKSGSPAMTVQAVDDTPGEIEVVWFDKNQKHTATFKRTLLTLDNPSNPRFF